MAAAQTDYPPLLVFSDPWGRHPSSCQHLIRRLLDRVLIYWIELIGVRRWCWDRYAWRRGWEQLRRWRQDPAKLANGLAPRLVKPWLWPSFRSRWARSFNRWQLLRQLPSFDRPPVVLTTLPVVADLVGAFPACRWVYYCLDDYAAWPGWDAHTLHRCEQRLLRCIDRLIVANPLLLERFAGCSSPVLWLTHGVDWDHFARVDRPEAAEDVKRLWQPPPAISPPWIVYWGLIDARLDAAWLCQLSRRLVCSVGASIVLIGPQDHPPVELTSLSNVYLLPQVSYDVLPAVAAHAAVLIAPYRDAPVTRAMQPLKFLEYLATGRPVVARRLPALQRWADAADLADGPEQFAELVLLRLRTGLPQQQRQVRQRLRVESWEAKAELLERWLFAD